MSTTLTVAAAQLSSGDDLAANLAAMAAAVAEAAERGAQVVLLPENFAWFGDEAGRRRLAEPVPSVEAPIQAALGAAAAAHGVWVIAGGMPERGPDGSPPWNTLVVVDPSGRVTERYRKIHLFDVDLPDGQVMRESSATSAGDRAVVADVAGVRVGLSICYDLRFPELYRQLVDGGAEVLVVPAAFTLQTGKDHWEVLLRARAIESQCWVLAAAQWGAHPGGRRTFGQSLLVDPWGLVVARASERTEVLVGRIDLALTERVRSRLPSLAHRRLR